MEIRYRIADPTGNITVLVTSQIPADKRAEVAAFLLKTEPEVQQLGFVSEPEGECSADLQVDMAGGEFCGNASLSAAALYALGHSIEKVNARLKVSGAENFVSVAIEKIGTMVYNGCVSMPLPEEIFPVDIELGERHVGFPVVRFKGIVHGIYEGTLPKEEAEELTALLCKKTGADAAGIMQLDMEEKTILPYVCVPGAGTGFWESSCASGTAAAGYYCYHKYNCSRFEQEFSEPAGVLKVSYDGRELLMTGNVVLGEEKIAYTE